MIFKTRDTLFKEPLSPHADDFTTGIESGCNLIVLQSLGCQEDDLRTDDLKIWQRILGCTPRQFPGVFMRQQNLVWAFSWHGQPRMGNLLGRHYATISPVKQVH